MNDSHHNDYDDHSGHHIMGHIMTMYFHSNISNDYVLFEQWRPSTPAEMIWTCIIMCVLAVSYEGVKYYREYLLKSWRMRCYYVSDTPNDIRTNGITNGGLPGRNIKGVIRRRMLLYPHLFQTVLHMLQFFISYLLMLVFMTYNVYLCISVLIGGGIGYFLFGWYKSSAIDIVDHPNPSPGDEPLMSQLSTPADLEISAVPSEKNYEKESCFN